MIRELSNPNVYQFLIDHENSDPTKLVLSEKKHPEIPLKLVASQIKSRIKAKNKLPEWYNTPGILFPHGVSLEQCSSEITAKYKSSLVSGDSFVDLTGGTGVDSYYLSKAFDNSTYIEQDSVLCELAAFNFKKLESDITVINSSAEKYLQSLTDNTACIYLDPSRRSAQNQKVYLIEDCAPDILEIQDRLIEKGDKVLIKFSPMLDIAELLKKLRKVTEIHIVSVQNDCKEVLVKLEKQEKPVRINTVNFSASELEKFEFSTESEDSKHIEYSLPGTYLFEPNASIMKSGGFKSLAEEYKLSKLHPNSHLFTSVNFADDFPGRRFKVLAIESLKKKQLAKHTINNKANISVRNFPLSVAAIRKKTGILEGGEVYLFATTLRDEQRKVLICQKID